MPFVFTILTKRAHSCAVRSSFNNVQSLLGLSGHVGGGILSSYTTGFGYPAVDSGYEPVLQGDSGGLLLITPLCQDR